jgi:hypothetical protein
MARGAAGYSDVAAGLAGWFHRSVLGRARLSAVPFRAGKMRTLAPEGCALRTERQL